MSTVLAALLEAVGTEGQEAYGRPAFALAHDFTPGDTTIYLSSILGLPAQGWLWVGGYLVRYTDVVWLDTAVATTASLPRVIPRGSAVVSATQMLYPDSYELFWLKSSSTYDHYDTWPE